MINKLTKLSRSHLALIIAAGLFIFTCICGLVINVLPSASPKPTAVSHVPASLSTSTPSNVPTQTHLPTDTPAPTATPAPQAVLKAALGDKLSQGNRDLPRITELTVTDGVLIIVYTINDNLSNSWIKKGAMLDLKNILELTTNADFGFTSLVVTGTFSMADVYGNTEESDVLRASYTRKTLERVNWNNFLFDNVFTIADSTWLHPELKDDND